MFPNFLFVVLAALVPIVIGFLYYSPKAFGNAWMKATGLTPEKLQTGNKAVIFGTAIILSLMLSFMLFTMVVHQSQYYSILINEPGFGEDGSAIMNEIAVFMEKYGTNFRTFQHGAFHGTIVGIFIGLPIIMINGLFETRGFKYGFINTGYWIITLALMGGILCQWA